MRTMASSALRAQASPASPQLGRMEASALAAGGIHLGVARRIPAEIQKLPQLAHAPLMRQVVHVEDRGAAMYPISMRVNRDT
ncbi:hypothetical protein M758_4G210000 [Ceratodon purpureus]|nr:hypothetical protein M758_4G210000 [Ceratodon purpureus]